MLIYSVRVGIQSLRQHSLLTLLMVICTGVGVAASTTVAAVVLVLTADPIPNKSSILVTPQLDPRSAKSSEDSLGLPTQLTRFDASALLEARWASRQAMMANGVATIELGEKEGGYDLVSLRATTRDFFSMFEVPFMHGAAWTLEEEDSHARVVVINAEVSSRIFGTVDSIGENLSIEGQLYRIVGVTQTWSARPKFFDLEQGRFGEPEQVYVPFDVAIEDGLRFQGTMDCWGSPPKGEPEGRRSLHAPCTWVQYWAEVPESDQSAYFQRLRDFAHEQVDSGRFERDAIAKISNIDQWLALNGVVPREVWVQTWIALGFLLLCLVNTSGLLHAKFLRKKKELEIRRAVGASRVLIFSQMLVESALVGLLGGTLGVVLSYLGVHLLSLQPNDYASLLRMDERLLVFNYLLALFSITAVGIPPAWRATFGSTTRIFGAK